MCTLWEWLQDRVVELIRPLRDFKTIWQIRIEASRALLDLEFHCKGIDAGILLFIKYVEEEPSLRGLHHFLQCKSHFFMAFFFCFVFFFFLDCLGRNIFPSRVLFFTKALSFFLFWVWQRERRRWKWFHMMLC
jgi:hypothetical protein